MTLSRSLYLSKHLIFSVAQSKTGESPTRRAYGKIYGAAGGGRGRERSRSPKGRAGNGTTSRLGKEAV